MIHLDTSFLVQALVPGTPEDKSLRRWVEDRTPLAMSAVGWAELLCGPLEDEDLALARRLIRDIVPFEAEDGLMAARLFNATGRRRGSLADCTIAAAAIRAGAPLATSNGADFKRLAAEGLQLAVARR